LDAVDDATHVVDLEGDVPEPRTVRGRRRLLSAGGRRAEAHHLEHVAPVGAARVEALATVGTASNMSEYDRSFWE
jgi:hypothetical protein